MQNAMLQNDVDEVNGMLPPMLIRQTCQSYGNINTRSVEKIARITNYATNLYYTATSNNSDDCNFRSIFRNHNMCVFEIENPVFSNTLKHLAKSQNAPKANTCCD